MSISAIVVGDSKTKHGHCITSLMVTFPRIILAELNTHRILSKNSASSRAIPFLTMLKSVMTNSFIPIAWQKNHSGMQGTEYLSKTDKFQLASFMAATIETLNQKEKGTKEYEKEKAILEEKMELFENILRPYEFLEKTLDEWWLFARDKAVEAAAILYVFDATKQLCNRLL